MTDQELNRMILRIEEALNERRRRAYQSENPMLALALSAMLPSQGDMSKMLPPDWSDEECMKLFEAIERRDTDRSALIEAIYDGLRERKYVFEDGQLDVVRFYRDADIGASVWSTLTSGKNKPSKDTMLKIVLALRLNEERARELLALGGYAFTPIDPRDKYILACIDCEFYTPERVYVVLECYGRQDAGVKQLFTAPGEDKVG